MSKYYDIMQIFCPAAGHLRLSQALPCQAIEIHGMQQRDIIIMHVFSYSSVGTAWLPSVLGVPPDQMLGALEHACARLRYNLLLLLFLALLGRVARE